MLPDAALRLSANASSITRAAAEGIRPDPPLKVSDWAAEHRIVPDIGSLPGPWRNEIAPYLVDPMDALSPDDPCEQVVMVKPSQSGGSAIGENWLGFIMHRTPGPAMYIGPTVKAAKDWKVEKLDPTIAASPVLSPMKGGVVISQTSRSGEGSTSDRIKFRGGFLLFAGANSAATLRQHSIRFMVRDDRSAWTDNADGEGDPRALSDQRLKTFRVFGLSKVLDVSSPLYKGGGIDTEYEASDQRRYYMACKKCGALTDWEWEDVKKADAPPYKSHVMCPVCDEKHTEADKTEMLSPAKGACWIPAAPDANGEVPPKTIKKRSVRRWRNRETGRYVKGYQITGVMNVFDRWDMIAGEEEKAGDDPELVLPFVTTILGRAYEAKGEGPPWESLAARRDPDLVRGELPAGPLYITFAVDVQGDGLYWERVGWGPRKQSWTIDHGYCAGETDAPLEGAWQKLDRIVESGTRFAGIRLADDLIGVDSGYNADAVYQWIRRRPNALALKGEDGWSKLPIFRAQSAEIRKRGVSAGKAKRYGIKVWLVGTWGIKGALMIYLGRTFKEGDPKLPTGFCRFPGDCDDEYFRQLCNEYVKVTEEKGQPVRRWEKRGPNHWLDCRVYNWALTHYAGLWSWDEEQWDVRAGELTAMTEAATPDMFDRTNMAMPAPAPLGDDDDDSPEQGEQIPAAVNIGQRSNSTDDGLDALKKLNR